ncbi:hypothetical protein QOZ88_13960 [Blastococcus sp. BMG 814]|uniref:GIY-YIG nuclease family protein n=1 Tax=Blastococcus carthaginiensis TaxID=3050034 RepID=A0ABT9IDT3_9ACTN|nr:hypothetical protein [Blastococcus carthaginiensis]MDP5183741.1 hypothetical protein [Blastococcus carthaginiensis]
MRRSPRSPTEMLEVVATWDLVPLEDYPGPHKPWRCRCLRCGTEVTPTYAGMTDARKKNACRECDKRHRRALFLASHEEMAAIYRSHGFEPLGEYSGNHQPWPSVHLVCGELCAPYPANVKSRGGGCDVCAREVRGSKRRVDEAVAVAIMRAAGLVPLVPYPTSGEPWACRCDTCQSEVSPTYDNVRAGTGGCRPCGRYGLDWDGPAIVYVLTQAAHLAVKVGIAKARPTPGSPSRVDSLSRRFGWAHYARLQVPTGREAYRIEQAVLRVWRKDLRLPPHLGPHETEGHTETVSLDAISEEQAWQYVLTAARPPSGGTPPAACL